MSFDVQQVKLARYTHLNTGEYFIILVNIRDPNPNLVEIDENNPKNGTLLRI